MLLVNLALFDYEVSVWSFAIELELDVSCI